MSVTRREFLRTSTVSVLTAGAAARKYGRVVQHGTQSRANPRLIRDMALRRDGFNGKIVHSRGVVYKNGNRNAIGRGAPGPVPPYLDWTLWQGPAQDKPFLIHKDRQKPGLYVHYDWHWFWEYGNGEIGNQGVHEMDIACLHCQIGNIAYRVGHTLFFDPASEQFTNSAEANAFLKRNYPLCKQSCKG